jgi:hypothetical protein
MTKAMLLDAILSKAFWAEAMSHAALIVNQKPRAWELFYGIKPDLTKLIIFRTRVTLFNLED